MFDWEDLRYFVAFSQEQSLAKAARQLKVDHATVARRIASTRRNKRSVSVSDVPGSER